MFHGSLHVRDDIGRICHDYTMRGGEVKLLVGVVSTKIEVCDEPEYFQVVISCIGRDTRRAFALEGGAGLRIFWFTTGGRPGNGTDSGYGTVLCPPSHAPGWI